jgi:hypothetical protein
MGRRFVACFGLTLLVYVPRAYRTLCLTGDSAELVTAAALWGVPHPPGYPLNVLVGHALARLPWLELPFRVHSASAILHAATVAVVARTIERITGRTGPALLGAATLALSRVFFAGSLYAEVFPLNDLFFAALLLLGVLAAYDTTGQRRPWLALAIAGGMAAAHHHMIALAVPGLAVLIGPAAANLLRRRPLFCGALAVIAVAIALSSFALVGIAAARDPLLSWDDVHDLRSLAHLATRQDYGGLFHSSRRSASGQLLERLDAFALSTGRSFGWVALALAAFGLLWGFRHAPRCCVALITAFGFTGPLLAVMNAVDLHSEYRRAFFERFATMSHVPIAILVGLGFTHAFDWMRSSARISPGFRLPMLAGVLGLLSTGPLIYGVRDLDFSGDRLGIAYAHDLVASTPDRSLILLKGDMATQAALYVCGVEKRCGDRIVLAPLQFAMPWKLAQDRRRYPELGLGDADSGDFAGGGGVAGLVQRQLPNRPVFLHPELLDDALRGEQSALPSMLLYRVYPNESALRADLPDFRAKLSSMVTGATCEGCSLPRPIRTPPAADAQLRETYAAALRSNLAAAEQLGMAVR